MKKPNQQFKTRKKQVQYRTESHIFPHDVSAVAPPCSRIQLRPLSIAPRPSLAPSPSNLRVT